MNKSGLILVIPTYNEIGSLPTLLQQIIRALPRCHILFVDDGSKDGTLEFIENQIVGRDQFFVLSRTKKLGLGTAYRDGFNWAVNSGYQWVGQMDADGSHQVSDLVMMFNKLSRGLNCDLIIGSRWIPGGKILNWPKSREVLSKCANFYARKTLNFKIFDSTAGFRIYSSNALRLINFNETKCQGYGFQIEMSFAASCSQLTIHEHPITFIERVEGRSKMTKGIVIEAFFRVLALRIFKRHQVMKLINEIK